MDYFERFTNALYHSFVCCFRHDRDHVSPAQNEFSSEDSFFYAAKMGDSESILRWVLDRNTNVDRRDRWGHTALMLAAQNGHAIDTILILLGMGAWVEAVNQNGDTALMFAAVNGQVDAVRILLSAGAFCECPE